MQPLKAEIAKMDTEELEEYIDSRYEARAPQSELEALETAFAERVSEDEPNITEDEPNMAEAHDMGVDLEEWLAYEYYRYLKPETEWGGRNKEDFFKPEVLNDFLSLHLKPNVTQEEILNAARDAYEYKTKIIQRQRTQPEHSNMLNM